MLRSSLFLMQQSVWKAYSANFAFTAFSRKFAASNVS
jgi:hypothetical protein